MYEIIEEFPVVFRPVLKLQTANPGLLASHIVSFVLSILTPNLEPFSMLLIILPLTLVNHPVFLSVVSVAVGLVVFPVALVDVSVLVEQLAITTGHIALPVADVNRAVLPPVGPESVSLVLLVPVSLVDTAVFEVDDFLLVRQNGVLSRVVFLLFDQGGKLGSFLVVDDFALLNLEHQIGLFVHTLIFAVSHKIFIILFFIRNL